MILEEDFVEKSFGRLANAHQLLGRGLIPHPDREQGPARAPRHDFFVLELYKRIGRLLELETCALQECSSVERPVGVLRVRGEQETQLMLVY